MQTQKCKVMRLHIFYTILVLLIAKNALADPPSWTVAHTSFQNSMTFTGVVKISGVESMDTNDILAAYIGTECRGVVKPIFLSSINRCLFFLVVYSNSSSGENISFKVYDASKDSVITPTQTYPFASFSSIGDIANPYSWNNAVAGYSISGTITYDNAAKTPIGNAKVSLKTNGIIIDSVNTNSSGFYSFASKPNGTYTLLVESRTPWGGVSSADKVVILRNTVGVLNPPLSGIRLKGADVNASGTANAADGTVILRRVVGVLSSFVAGDWIFNPDTIRINGAAITMDFQGICVGDANGSYSPATKTSTTVNLTKSSVMAVNVGDIVDIPIRVSHTMQTGAISLFIAYPKTALQILSVTSNSTLNASMLTRIDDGKIYIGWGDLQAYNFQATEEVISIKAKVISINKSFDFTLFGNCEFVDNMDNVHQNVELTYPELVQMINIDPIENNSDVDLVISPNPFSQSTQISYSSKEQNTVTIEIFDVCGKKVREQSFRNQTVGKYSFTLTSEELKSGVYYCTISVNSNSGISKQTKRLIISK